MVTPVSQRGRPRHASLYGLWRGGTSGGGRVLLWCAARFRPPAGSGRPWLELRPAVRERATRAPAAPPAAIPRQERLPMAEHANPPDGEQYVGKPIRAVESVRYITGRGQYVDDLALPGMLHAAFLRSPHAHASLNAVDASAARERPDVAAVLTGAEAQQRATRLYTPLNVPGYRDCGGYCLAVDKVRYVGEPIALVAAESRYAAEDAAEAIVVDYHVLPPVTDPEAALEPGAPLLYPELGDNVAVHATFQGGDPD